MEADIFLSHAHWDHIQGLPYFAPLFAAGNRITLWSTAALMPAVDQALRRQMSPTVFPVPFDEVAASVSVRALDEPHRGAGYVLRTMMVRHPGGSLAYRVSHAGDEARSLVYVSDNELGDAPGYDRRPGWREELVTFAHGASLLVHDAMYTVEEYGQHRGWGHSHIADTVALAIDAEVHRLALFHHSPDRSDRDVERLVEECRALAAQRGARVEILAAAEGHTLTV